MFKVLLIVGLVLFFTCAIVISLAEHDASIMLSATVGLVKAAVVIAVTMAVCFGKVLFVFLILFILLLYGYES